MIEYEILYLVGESKKPELETIKRTVEKVLVGAGGEIEDGEFVDERRMEYPIRGERRGTYIAKRFRVQDGAGDVPSMVTKALSLEKDVLRFLVVRADGLPTLLESQDRVRRAPDTRRRTPGRYQSGRSQSFRNVPMAPREEPAKPALTDTEIDKKLGEVLDI